MSRSSKFLYTGKFLNSDDSVRYRYIEINEDNSLGEKWSFQKKLFKKGSIGSIYPVDLKGTTVAYSTSEIPTSFVQINDKLVSTFIHFERLHKDEELSRQVDIKIRNSKTQKNKVDIEIEQLREVYRSLPLSKRQFFVADLVYKLCK